MYVGNSFTAHNCSENFKQSFINFDDGTNQVLVNNSYAKTYYFTGNYNMTIETFSSNNNDIEAFTANFNVNVKSPEKKDLLGEWRAYHFVGYDETFPTLNENIFDNTIVEDINQNFKVVFNENSTASLKDLEGTYNKTVQWYFIEPGKMQMDTLISEIISYRNDTMIILSPYRHGFSLNYMARYK